MSNDEDTPAISGLGRRFRARGLRNFLLLLVSGAGFAFAGCGGDTSTTPAPAPAPAPTPPPQTDDHGDTQQTATVVRLPSTTQGRINPGNDVDYFRLQVRSAGTLTVYTTGLTDTYGTLSGPSGLSREDDDSGSVLNFRIAAFVSPGVHHVRVSSFRSTVGAYALEVRFSARQADDHGDTQQTATVIRLPSTTQGRINPGNDVDYFRLQVRSAGTLTVYTTGAVDTIGQLFRPSGGGTDDDDSGSLLNFRIAAVVSPGVHHVRVSSFRSSVGAYALEVRFSAGQGDDHGDTQQTATVVRLPSTTRGELEVSDDADFFRFELRSPATLTVYTTGSTDTVGSLQGPGLGVGSRVESDDDGGSGDNFRIVMSGALPGTYYVGVTGFFSFSVGDYELHVRAEDPGGSGTTDNIDFEVTGCRYDSTTEQWTVNGFLTANRDILNATVAACVRPRDVARNRCDMANRHFVGETELGNISTGQTRLWSASGRSSVISDPDTLVSCSARVVYDFGSSPTKAGFRHSFETGRTER